MKDQLEKLHELGIRATQLNSTPQRRRAAGRARRHPRPLARDRVLHARAAGECRIPRRAQGGRHLAGGDRRGALHLAVGPRFPSGLPRDGGLDRGARPPAGPGADRHRHRRRHRGHRQAARPPAPERHQHRHLPAEPALQRGPGGQCARKNRRRAAHRARLERLRHRLRRHRQGGRGDARGAARSGRERHHLSRQAAGARTQGKPGPVHGRPAPRDGRHQRLRHGHRQAATPAS